MSGFLPFFNSEGGPPIGPASGDLGGTYPGPTITLAGDVTGRAGATTVGKIEGVAISGTPVSNDALVATSATTANWQNITLGTPAFNPSWYALTDVYLDPVSGVDTNTGMVGSPVKTMVEVIRRYGSSDPQLVYGQNLTIHQLSAQPAGVDAFFFNPKNTGGTYFLWDGYTSMPTVGAAFSPTTVVARVQTAAGNDLQLSGNLPNGIAVGQVVHNVTRNSWAFVYAVAGSVATISQPITDASMFAVTSFPVPDEDNGWVNTDTYHLYQPLLCNWKNPSPVGGDIDANALYGTAIIQGVCFASAPGTSTYSTMSINPIGALYIRLCSFDTYTEIDGSDTDMIMILGCLFTAGFGSTWCNLLACACTAGSIAFINQGCLVDAGTIFDTVVVENAYILLGEVHIITTGYMDHGSHSEMIGGVSWFATNTTGIIWGAGTLNVENTSSFTKTSSSTWASLLKMGTLQIDGGTVGSAVSGGLIKNNITVTSANLDTYHGLQSLRSGSRFGDTTTDTANTILSDGCTGATTNDASVYTIYTDTALTASQMMDYSISVAGWDPTDGYVTRGDFTFTLARIGSASAAYIGATPVPLNVRTSTGASGWGGPAIAIAGNAMTITVQGGAGKTVDWSCTIQRILVT